jgi:hypothetical protein
MMFKFEVGELVLVGQMKKKGRVTSREDCVKTHGTNVYCLEDSPPMYEYELHKVDSTTGEVMRIDVPYKEMSYEQLTYNPKTDRRFSVEDGLYVMHHDGWELVASYSSPVGATTMFIFRKRVLGTRR